MTSKHKIIGLTSLILTASAGYGLCEASTVNTIDIKALTQPHIHLGPHGVTTGKSQYESGESGEGGFDNQSLETDDIAFLTALNVIRAHYAIGEKLYAAHDYNAAENFFGHPITEVLIELKPAFKHRNIKSLEEPMYDLLDIAQNKNDLVALKKGIEKVLNDITLIQNKIKKEHAKTYIKIISTVNADLLRRSKLEYFQAIKTQSLGHLQDAIGYFNVASALFETHKQEYQSLDAEKSNEIDTYFTNLKPYFDDYKTINIDKNHKKLAGMMAKIELFLINI